MEYQRSGGEPWKARASAGGARAARAEAGAARGISKRCTRRRGERDSSAEKAGGDVGDEQLRRHGAPLGSSRISDSSRRRCRGMAESAVGRRGSESRSARSRAM